MKTNNLKFPIIFVAIFVLLAGKLLAQSTHVLPQLGKSPVKDLIAAMTLEEKATMVIGYLPAMAKIDQKKMDMSVLDFDYPGLGFPIAQVKRLGVSATIASDGSYGLKKYFPGPGGKWGTTAFPIPILVACSWDTELAEKVGATYGNEGKENGVDILLGPAMNIMRDPLCGRNFEYFSEDPLLSGKLSAAAIRGIQSNNVGATIKHFVANDQETNRIANDSRLTTRALREIYLRGFEIAVKEADPWMIMTSYNKVNGTYTSERRDLLMDVVRGEWGYKGAFMTDFNGIGWAPWQIKAGNDLIMPGSTYNVQNIIKAVNDGSLDEKDLDNCVENLLNYVVKTNHFKGYKYSGKIDAEADARIARTAAAEGFVLLKNNNTLPFGDNTNAALFGTAAYDLQISGKGSGNVNSDYKVNISDGLKNINNNLAEYYKEYITKIKSGVKTTPGSYLGGRTFEVKDTLVNDNLIKEAAEKSDIAVLTIGRNAGEGADRKPEKGDWLLSDDESQMLKKVSGAFHAAGKKVVVILNINGIVETANWKDLADAILVVWLPGQEGGNAIADVLTGKVNPSGKLSSTFPLSYFDAPTSKNFPYDYVIPKGKDAFDYSATISNVYENGKTKRTEKPEGEWIKNVDYTNYEEDVYVGYRYYQTFGKEVSYPFGFGLSYTTFKYGKPVIKETADGYDLTIEIQNNGPVAGKEIVQVYATAPNSAEGRPEKELIAFSKTKLLAPGETQEVTMHFTDKELAWYNDSLTSWILDAGKYKIQCAASVADIRSEVNIDVPEEKVVERTTDSVRPQFKLNVLRNTK